MIVHSMRRKNRAAELALCAALASLSFAVGCFEEAKNAETMAKKAASQQLWTCGMHPQVIQKEPGFCPICGMELTPLKADLQTGAATGERKIQYWWDPMMNPPYISDKPGKSPMGMDLVPVYEDEVSGGPAITIDPAVVQNMGVRLATAHEGKLRTTIRAVGFLAEAEPNQYDVNLRVSGWIERLHADTVGMHLYRGRPLFDLYSPELQVAIDELIAARKARRGGSDVANTLYSSAVNKLRLLGLEKEQIERLATLGKAPATVTFESPLYGHLVEKSVVKGSAVKAGERIMRIVDHATLWLDAQVFEQHLAFIRLGLPIRARIEAVPEKEFSGKIIFIHPHVDETTRTATVRFEIPNPSLDLRPGMYATVEIVLEVALRALLIPREAVIDTGTRQIAFVAREAGRFEPRRVKMGAAADDGMVQVLSGLMPGEQVVVSGQFLLDSESRLREAVQKMLAEQSTTGGPAKGADFHGVHGH